MAVRPILQWPDRRLKTPVPPLAAVTDETRTTWNDMADTMYAMPGVGLAAVQIGVMQRLAVVDASDSRDGLVRMANPEIVHASVKPRAHDEASPCLPGVSARLERPRAVTVRFLNAAGEPEERDFTGLWATSVQHQIDHLDGKLYIDRLKPVKRRMLLARADKLRRRG